MYLLQTYTSLSSYFVEFIYRFIWIEKEKVTCFEQVVLKEGVNDSEKNTFEVPSSEENTYPDKQFWDFSNSSSHCYDLTDNENKPVHELRYFNTFHAPYTQLAKSNNLLRCYTSSESRSRPLLFYSLSCSVIAHSNPEKNKLWMAYCLCYDTEDIDRKTKQPKLKWIGDLGITMCNNPKVRADVYDFLSGSIQSIVGQTSLWR